MMDISADGIVALKRRECPPPNFDFVLFAYDDKIFPLRPAQPDEHILGTLTIGAGHTGSDVKVGMTITPDQGAALLRRDLSWVRDCINKLCTPPTALTQNQIDALFSFVYNIGEALFAKSSVLRYINAGQLDKVPDGMRLYNKAKDRKTGQLVDNEGLANRRTSEIGQWSKGAYVASASVDVAEPPRFDPALKAKVTAIGSAIAGAATAIGGTITSTQASVSAAGGHWSVGIVFGALAAIALAIIAAWHANNSQGGN